MASKNSNPSSENNGHSPSDNQLQRYSFPGNFTTRTLLFNWLCIQCQHQYWLSISPAREEWHPISSRPAYVPQFGSGLAFSYFSYYFSGAPKSEQKWNKETLLVGARESVVDKLLKFLKGEFLSPLRSKGAARNHLMGKSHQTRVSSWAWCWESTKKRKVTTTGESEMQFSAIHCEMQHGRLGSW